MIDVRDLTFSYPTASAPAIAGLDFQVADGEIFGFLGPSGAGKSTTQNVLIGLLRGYRGSLSVLGKDLGAWGPEYYECIGVSFEQPNHYLKLTARENLAYFASLYAGPTEEPEVVLDWLDLGAHADQRVSEFSKGMRNRLNLARALLHRPRLLFLDEPTAGLDPVNAQRVRELIAERRDGGSTVFLTTHDMWTAEHICDRVAFIVDGRIPLIDSPRALKLQHGRRSVRLEVSGASGISVHDFSLDGLADNREFLDALRGGRVETIHSLEASLDDVFIAVTGRPLT